MANRCLKILRIWKFLHSDGIRTLMGPTIPQGKRHAVCLSFPTVNSVSRGNNGRAYFAIDDHYAGESLKETYAYAYNISLEPNTGDNLDAAIVNAFYLLNMVHDITYRYGFTEVAFNFQETNFDRGGKENDGITVGVNHGPKYNNAFFTTLAECVPFWNIPWIGS